MWKVARPALLSDRKDFVVYRKAHSLKIERKPTLKMFTVWNFEPTAANCVIRETCFCLAIYFRSWQCKVSFKIYD